MADQAQTVLSQDQQAAMMGELRRQRDEALDRLVAYAAQKAQMTEVLTEAQETLTELYNQVASLRAEVAEARANQPTTIDHGPVASAPAA